MGCTLPSEEGKAFMVTPFYEGGTEAQYEAVVAAAHPAGGGLPPGQRIAPELASAVKDRVASRGGTRRRQGGRWVHTRDSPVSSEPEPSPEPPLGSPAVPTDRRRVRTLVDRGRRWTEGERARFEQGLEARRETSQLIGAGFDIADLDLHVGGGILAGAVAFRMFLLLVPFVYVCFTVLGWVAKALNQNPEHLAKVLGITGILASAVVNTQSIGIGSQIALLVGASFAMLITANSLAKTLFVVHWLVWRVPRAKPSGLRPIATTIGIALVLTVLSVATNGLRAHFGLTGSLFVVLLVTGIAFFVWWGVSWQLPHAPVSPRQLIPGALFVALGADVMHALTTYWIGGVVARKSNTYGAIGIALAVLLWVYVFGRILVASAGINATLWRREVREDRE
jgi:uncharacterized BrkB/YihY/UPF0761 family membrane protein